jgi:hypothetical protein
MEEVMVRIAPLRRSLAKLSFVGLIGLLAAGAAGPVQARATQPPKVLLGDDALMSADGGAVSVTVLASCPAGWSVTEARVTAVQGGVSGSGTIPLVCGVSLRPFRVVMPASAGAFHLGDAQLSAVVRIQRGRTAEARDAATVRLIPEVFVDAASTARLGSGGGVTIDVTTACPAGTTGQESYATVEQGGRAIGTAFFTPVCDGARHTIRLAIQTRTGPFQVGPATVTAFAFIDVAGESFTGVDSSAIEIVSS